MRKIAVCRSVAVLLLLMCLLHCASVEARDAGRRNVHRALVDVAIPIEDGMEQKTAAEPTFCLFADEVTDPCTQIHADSVWNYETYGNEVNVAVIDTGCATQPALAETLKKNYYFEKTVDEDGYTDF